MAYAYYTSRAGKRRRYHVRGYGRSKWGHRRIQLAFHSDPSADTFWVNADRVTIEAESAPRRNSVQRSNTREARERARLAREAQERQERRIAQERESQKRDRETREATRQRQEALMARARAGQERQTYRDALVQKGRRLKSEARGARRRVKREREAYQAARAAWLAENPSIARFRMLDLDDDAPRAPEPEDNGPGRQLIID